LVINFLHSVFLQSLKSCYYFKRKKWIYTMLLQKKVALFRKKNAVCIISNVLSQNSGIGKKILRPCGHIFTPCWKVNNGWWQFNWWTEWIRTWIWYCKQKVSLLGTKNIVILSIHLIKNGKFSFCIRGKIITPVECCKAVLKDYSCLIAGTYYPSRC
jgi:hypothetical protein